MLDIAPGAVLWKAKLRLALELLHGKSNINMTKKEDDIVMDCANDNVRMGLAHLRNLKLDKASLHRAGRKSTEAEMRVIHRLLEKIRLEKDEASAPTSTPSPDAVRKSGSVSSFIGGDRAGFITPPRGSSASAPLVGQHGGNDVEDTPLQKTPEEIFQDILKVREDEDDDDSDDEDIQRSPDDALVPLVLDNKTNKKNKDDAGSFVVPGLKVLIKKKNDKKAGPVAALKVL